MNKNQKDYVNSINEIKVDEDIRKGVLNKMKEKEKRNYKPIYLYATMAIVFVLMISIALPLGTNLNETNPAKVIADNGGLPRVGDFKKLYKILDIEGSNDNNYMSRNSLNLDMAVAESEGIAPQSESAEKQVSGMGEGAASDYSTTNVQVEGVDEADIVKTDGKYIYYISAQKLVIVDAGNPENLKILSELEFKNEDNVSFTPQELYIQNNKVILIGTKYVYEQNQNGEVDIMPYARKIYYPSSETYTVAKVYNVENKSNIKLEREIEIEGYYLTSRMIGENVYFLANKALYFYAYEHVRMQDLDENEFKPKYTDTAVGEEEKCIEFQDIAYFPESEEKSYLNIAGFNVNDNNPANIESYLGAGNNVYVSENNIYVTNTKYEYKDTNRYGYYNNYEITTYIYKFGLKGSKVEFNTIGSVPGAPLNQFSMDEKDGYFRIATTDSKNWEQESNTNNLYVLDGNLDTVGKLENLAKGESIYSVRFMGDRAYIVTFVQVDPLFVIDLSNPRDPKVLGELKIPGYSNYLHPYDENHIIGFGQDTEVKNYGYGEVVVNIGMKMALFDVTDPNNPKELYAVKIGDRGTYSELLNNHKALLFSKEKNIIAFPISISQDVNNYNSSLKFQGAIVYGLDLETGFSLRGQIAHMSIQNGYRDYDYTKEVERIIYIKDDLFTLSKGLIKATDMNTMEERGKVEISVPEEKYYPYYGIIE